MEDELREKIAKKVKIEVVDGVGGFSLYINDTRIAGPKPLGGGRAVASFCVTEQTVNDALPNLAPVLADAEKWRKISSLVEGNCNSCKSLKYCEKNDIHPCEILKDALEGEGEKR